MKTKHDLPSLDNAQQFYQERVAGAYDAQRTHKTKWRLEHAHLKSTLMRIRGKVLDVPVGTGRFLQLYKDLGLSAVGVDYNPAMLAQARIKHPDAVLEQGDVTTLRYPDSTFDAVVCVRLLHLIAPAELPLVMKELFRVSCHHVVVTVHLASHPYVRGRSQVHTLDSLLACRPEHWLLTSSTHLMLEKGMPYYMLRFVR